MAGGITVDEEFLQQPFLADSHSHPMPAETLDLLAYALARHAPSTVVLERDDRLDAADEILGRRCAHPRLRRRRPSKYGHAEVGCWIGRLA